MFCKENKQILVENQKGYLASVCVYTILYMGDKKIFICLANHCHTNMSMILGWNFKRVLSFKKNLIIKLE